MVEKFRDYRQRRKHKGYQAFSRAPRKAFCIQQGVDKPKSRVMLSRPFHCRPRIRILVFHEYNPEIAQLPGGGEQLTNRPPRLIR